MHYNREMDEEDEELSRIVHVRSLSGSPPCHRGLAILLLLLHSVLVSSC